jgi:hypothetical protein
VALWVLLLTSGENMAAGDQYRIDPSDKYNFDRAIRERFTAMDELGSSANTIAAEQAERRRALAQANEAAAFARTAQAGANRTAGTFAGARSATNYQPPVAGGNFGKFMSAISAQESGGNYSARNPMSGAMGKYQIMPSNLAGAGRGWDYEVLGRDISGAQFLASPELQEKIASAKLKQYYNSYGPAGAAIAWYAGPGAAAKYVRGGGASTRGEAGGHPSISGYMASILRKMGLA